MSSTPTPNESPSLGARHWWVLALLALVGLGIGLQRQLNRTWTPPVEGSEDLLTRVVHRMQMRHPDVFGDWGIPTAVQRAAREGPTVHRERVHPSRLTLPRPLRFVWPRVDHIARYTVTVLDEAGEQRARAASEGPPLTLSFGAQAGATYRWFVRGATRDEDPLIEQTFSCLSDEGVQRFEAGEERIAKDAPPSIRAALHVLWAWHFGLWDRAFALAEQSAQTDPGAVLSATLGYLEHRTGWQRTTR